ncbi:type II secretion system F family protein [Fibrobacterota bacterium]
MSEAFSRHGRIFSDLYCHMIKAGESGGILDSILSRLAEYLEKAEKLARKIRGAMMYPLFVLIVAVAVIIVMLLKVVPTFAEMFVSFGGELPGPTKAVMGLSSFLQSYFYIILLITGGGAVFVYRFYKTEKGRFQVDRLLLKLPLLGDLIRKSSVARFTKTLGTLLGSGIPIIEALRVTSKTAGNRVLEMGIMKALESIKGGQTIAEPLKETGIFPPMVLQMIAVGEKTGKLSEMLDKVSEFYSDEVDSAVDTLTSMIEPVMIVVMGGIIGVILIAMYLPMFSMASTIG